MSFKNILFFFFLIFSLSGSGQSKIGVINDKDGYVNIRVDKSVKSQIISKVFINEFFTYFEDETSNWWLIETEKGDLGYMHRSRVSFFKKGYILKRKKLDDGASLTIKENNFKGYKILVFQINPKNYYYFNCKAILRVLKKGKLVDEINFPEINAVGGSFGVAFSEKQNLNDIFIASKFGDYEGKIIIINSKGKTSVFNGGQYFVDKEKKYIISNWSSDLSGLTIYDIKRNKVGLNDELDFHTGGWYFKEGKYLTPKIKGEKMSDEIYELDFKTFKLKKSYLKIEGAKKVEMEKQDCYCN